MSLWKEKCFAVFLQYQLTLLKMKLISNFKFSKFKLSVPLWESFFLSDTPKIKVEDCFQNQIQCHAENKNVSSPFIFLYLYLISHVKRLINFRYMRAHPICIFMQDHNVPVITLHECSFLCLWHAFSLFIHERAFKRANLHAWHIHAVHECIHATPARFMHAQFRRVKPH